MCRLFTLPEQMLLTIMGWIQIVSWLVSNANEVPLYGLFWFLTLHLLLTAEAFVGKGFFKKRVSYHSKGRSGIKVRPECRLTVVVRELTAEEEAQIARLRVHNFRKLTKREQRLVPHQLIETTPIWNRKGKNSNREPSMNAWAEVIPVFSSPTSGKVFVEVFDISLHVPLHFSRNDLAEACRHMPEGRKARTENNNI